MIINKTATYISNWIIKNINEKISNDEADIIQRKVSLILIYIYLGFSILLICTLSDLEVEIILSLLSLMFVRTFNDGIHFNSADTCFGVTLLAIMIVPFTHYYVSDSSHYPLLIFSLIVYLFTSQDYEVVDLIYLLRKVVVLIGVIYTYLFSEIMFLVFVLLTMDQIAYIRHIKMKNMIEERVLSG